MRFCEAVSWSLFRFSACSAIIAGLLVLTLIVMDPSFRRFDRSRPWSERKLPEG
jgi:hypothetical protein